MNPKVKAYLFYFSCILILAGAILQFIKWPVAPYLFAVGAAGFTLTYLTAPYKQLDFRLRRLHRFHIFAGILMIIASALMFKNRSEWPLAMTCGAIFQLYASFREPKIKQD